MINSDHEWDGSICRMCGCTKDNPQSLYECFVDEDVCTFFMHCRHIPVFTQKERAIINVWNGGIPSLSPKMVLRHACCKCGVVKCWDAEAPALIEKAKREGEL